MLIMRVNSSSPLLFFTFPSIRKRIDWPLPHAADGHIAKKESHLPFTEFPRDNPGADNTQKFRN